MTNSSKSLSIRLDTVEAAAHLGKSVSWLMKERARGRGPRFLKIGATVIYRLQDLEDYIESCVRETAESRSAAA